VSTVISIFLIIASALLRVARHFGFINLPPNFAPIAAVALFAGAKMERRTLAIFIPLAAMLVSDSIIGFYDFRILGSVYISFAISGVLGFFLRKRVNVWRVGISALFASIIFFLITNAAVWLFSGIYPVTIAGLLESYIMGLPFFRFTFLGDLFYTAVIFGVYEVVNLWTQTLLRTKAMRAIIRRS